MTAIESSSSATALDDEVFGEGEDGTPSAEAGGGDGVGDAAAAAAAAELDVLLFGFVFLTPPLGEDVFAEADAAEGSTAGPVDGERVSCFLRRF